MFFGWVFFLISLGGQAPHVLRAPMWALNTRGEPNEIELPIRVLTGYLPLFSRPRAVGCHAAPALGTCKIAVTYGMQSTRVRAVYLVSSACLPVT